MDTISNKQAWKEVAEVLSFTVGHLSDRKMQFYRGVAVDVYQAAKKREQEQDGGKSFERLQREFAYLYAHLTDTGSSRFADRIREVQRVVKAIERSEDGLTIPVKMMENLRMV